MERTGVTAERFPPVDEVGPFAGSQGNGRAVAPAGPSAEHASAAIGALLANSALRLSSSAESGWRNFPVERRTILPGKTLSAHWTTTFCFCGMCMWPKENLQVGADGLFHTGNIRTRLRPASRGSGQPTAAQTSTK